MTAITVDGGGDAKNYFTTTYDSAGRVSTVTYPSGYSVTRGYNTIGYEYYLYADGVYHWVALTRDAELHLTQRTRNGVVTSQGFDANTGRLSSASLPAAPGQCKLRLRLRRAWQHGEPQRCEHRPKRKLRLRCTEPADLGHSRGEPRTEDEILGLATDRQSAPSKSDVGTYSYPARRPARARMGSLASAGARSARRSATIQGLQDRRAAADGRRTLRSTSRPSITRGTTSVSFSVTDPSTALPSGRAGRHHAVPQRQRRQWGRRRSASRDRRRRALDQLSVAGRRRNTNRTS